MNISASELKKAAREKLLGNYSIVIGAAIVINIMIRIVSSILTAPIEGFSILKMLTHGISIPTLVLFYLANLIIIFLSDILNCGYTYVNYRIAQGKTTTVEDIFYVFSHNPFTVIKLFLIQIGIAVLLCIPFTIGLVLLFTFVLSMDSLINILLAYSVFVILILILMVLMDLLLFCCKFIYFENNDMPAFQIVKQSMQLMKGNKGRLLYLKISFIPIFLLSILTFGIANLWLSPYKMVTEANFYFSLFGKKPKAKPDWRPYISNADFSNIDNARYNPYNRF